MHLMNFARTVEHEEREAKNAGNGEKKQKRESEPNNQGRVKQRIGLEGLKKLGSEGSGQKRPRERAARTQKILRGNRARRGQRIIDAR